MPDPLRRCLGERDAGAALIPQESAARRIHCPVPAGPNPNQAAGLAIGWVEADAEQLPFADGRYDV
jgi:hypothetical protein